MMRVRDPVHNFISLREQERKLLDTAAMQRLRGIKQLAMAHLVYPGALHTRFDHSLGVLHVAGLMAEALRLSPDETEVVRFAALLHDLGHGPFSHVSEYALDRYADRSTLAPEQKQDKMHELLTAHIISNDDEIVDILGKDRCGNVAKLLARGRGQRALRSIVSGPLDADKQDYLLRDSVFCGVPYGIFDLQQMHRSLTLRGPEDDKEIMVDPNGIHSVEQYVLAKYYLTTNVYRHKVRLIADQMIYRAIVLGVEKDKNEALRTLYAFDNSSEFATEHLKWDDSRFMHEFCLAAETSRCKEMLERLRSRRLLKRVFDSKTDDFEAAEMMRKLLRPENDRFREDIERRIAEELSSVTGEQIDSDFVILNVFDIRSVRETSRNDESNIMIATDPKPRPFEEESTLFRSIDESYVDEFVEVYAPVAWDTITDKRKVRAEAKEPIRKVIEEVCSGMAKEEGSDGCE